MDLPLPRMIFAGLATILTVFAQTSWAGTLEPYQASPDQVLVLYNTDWKKDDEGSTPGQDSKEVAEYYQAMHTDPVTGRKPHILGLSCKHLIKGDHLNHWFIKEESNDNANGIVSNDKGPAPDGGWTRDSRKVEIRVDDPEVDWDSAVVTCRSKTADREVTLAPHPAGSPAGNDAFYNLTRTEKGGTITLDASKIFSGPVTVTFKIKNRAGKQIRDLLLRYYDAADFEFSPAGPDGIPDDKILEEDILAPVRKYLEDKANALADGTLLKDHILYIVVVHGMPYSGKAVFGIEHGVTPLKSDHGSLASLEQRLQTLYYKWTAFTPPVISFLMNGGPDSDKGVVNHIITTAMRHPLYGTQWNPYLHPDTHSFLSKNRRQPFFYDLAPLKRRREVLPKDFFTYAVTRIDGADAEEAKRIIDYSLYATKYLRPEMDCRVRASLAKDGKKMLTDLPERLARAEEKNFWGGEELKALGFATGPNQDSQGLPFLVRPEDETNGNCSEKTADWKVSGFYPGGIDRYVKSENGLNLKKAAIWDYISKGVSVSAAGAPASSGGPHITNASFWDNRILIRYLFRGRDLGESLLLSIYYTNWSTSLIGDPLMHVDLRKTVLDTTPPVARDGLEVRFESDFDKVTAVVGAELTGDAAHPEVAAMRVIFRDKDGNEVTGTSALYSKRPRAAVKGLRTDTDYTFKAILIDPYGNRTEIPEMTVRTKPANYPSSIFRKLFY